MSMLHGVRLWGPLEPYAQGFADELARQGYKVSGAKGQLFLATHLSRWLADRGSDVSVLASPEVTEALLAARRAAGRTNYRTVRALAPLLDYLRGLGLVGPASAAKLSPTQVLLERCRGYLTGERGLSVATARGYVDASGGSSPDARSTATSSWQGCRRARSPRSWSRPARGRREGRRS